MQLISAKQELEEVFNIKLTTEDKLTVLKAIMLDVENAISNVSNRKQRIPRLAKKQVLDECYDILKKYYAVERITND